MTRLTTRMMILSGIALSALLSSSAPAADTKSTLCADEIWFLVDTGLMDLQEAHFLLDEQSTRQTTKTPSPTTRGVSGLDLGSGRFQSVSGLDLGSGR